MTYRTKIIALSAAVVLLSVQAVAFTDIRSVIAQNQNRMPLLAEIVNEEDDPVPVSLQGTGDVSGNVTASQSGEWNVSSSQEGDWNVNAVQSGEWNVKTDDISDADKEIFHATVAPSITEAQDNRFSSAASFTVPSGKRLIIEHVSAKAFMKGGNRPTLVEIRTPPHTPVNGTFFPTTMHQIPMTEESGSIQGKTFVASEQVRIYVDGGDDVEIGIGRDGANGTAQIFVSVTGYLVDLPE